MDLNELASDLFGSKRAESSTQPSTVSVMYGIATSDSEDGLVSVWLSDNALSPTDAQEQWETVDSYDADAYEGMDESTSIEIPTEVTCFKDDVVRVQLTGAGAAKNPTVVGVVGRGDEQNQRLGSIEADYVKATELEADVAQIGFLKADSAVITNLQADTAKVHDLTADQLSAATAYIVELNTAEITAQTLLTDVAKVHTLTADELSAAAAYIADLKGDSIEAENIAAMYGDFGTVKANAAKVANLTAQELEADHATIASLDSNYAHITNGVIDNAKIGYADVNNLSAHYAEIQNGHINSALIDTAAIVDEQVFTVTGNKATLASIDASRINVTNLNADNITVNKINGQTVTGKSISDALTQHETDISAKVDTTTFNSTVSGLNDRIDGAIETFTGTVVPTLNNTPASAWNTNAKKDQHIGDVYYVVNANSDQNGYCYRFTKSGSTYSWQLIKDSDVTAALSRLQTAEGKITTFDSDISTLKTDTGELKTKTQTLETSLGDKVDVTTFNDLSSDVESNSSSITTLSNTVSQKADSSTVTTLSNTVNTVQQTATGNSTKISQLTQTLGTNADGTTKANDIVHRTSAVEQDLSGITTRVSATESELETVSNPNLSPFYSHEFYDGTYWASASSPYSVELGKCFTQLEDGWAHVDFDNSERTSNAYHNIYVKQPIDHIKPDTPYTFVYEVRNLSIVGDGALVLYGQDSQAGDQMASHGPNVTITEDGVYRMAFTSRSSFTDAMVRPVRVCLIIGASTNAQLDVRASLYEGNYKGQYKPYVDQTLSARVKHAETSITQNANAIELRATKTEAYQVAQPNLAPYFLMPMTQTTDDYWSNITYKRFTQLADGWAHFEYSNAGSSTANNYIAPKAISTLTPGGRYTVLVEFRNVSISATGGSFYVQQHSVSQVWGASAYGGFSIANTDIMGLEGGEGKFWKPITLLTADSKDPSGVVRGTLPKTSFMYINEQVYAGQSISYDVRISLYEGEYTGPYKPYSGKQLYASQAELKVANNEISARVEKNGVIAAINASVEEEGGSAVKIIADKVNIEGAAIFSNDGRLSQTSLDNAYDSKGSASAVQTNLDNLQIGSRNLLIDSAFQSSLGKCWVADGITASISNGTLIVNGSGGSGNKRVYQGLEWFRHTPDTTYAFSCDVVSSAACQIAFGRKYEGCNEYHVVFDVTTSVKRVSGVYTATNKAEFCIGQPTNNATVTISNIKLEKGNKATDWSPAPEDTEVISERVYYRSNSSTKPSAPTAWVADATGNVWNAWTTKVPPLAANKDAGSIKYLYLWTCEQRKSVSGIFLGCTAVQLDENTTVIDGGNIITNSVTANQIAASAVTADKIAANALTLGKFTASDKLLVDNSQVLVGGRNLLRHTGAGFSDFAVNTTSFKTHHLYSTGTTDTAYDGKKLADFGLEAGDQVTLSFDWATSQNGSNTIRYGTFFAEFYGVNADGTNGYTAKFGPTITMSASNASGHYSQTMTLTALTANTLRMVMRIDNSCLVMSVSNVKLEKGNKATDWSPAPEDTEVISERVYYRSNSSTKPSAPTAWVADATGNVWNAWTTKVPPLAANKDAGSIKYLYLWTCEQRKSVSGIFLGCTAVQLDENTTVIDGGNIITNSVTANQIAASAVTADKIAANALTLGKFTASDKLLVDNSQVLVGGRNLLRHTGAGFSDFAVNTTSFKTHHLYSTGTTDTAYDGKKLADFGLEAGDQVTLSFDWATSQNGSNTIRYGTFFAEFYGVNADGTNGYTAKFGPTITMSASNASGHYSQTMTLTALTANTLRMVMRIDNSCLVMSVSNVKLEKGNKATDWSPAPEDMATSTDYEDVSKQVSGHEDALKKITEDYEKVIDRIDGLESTTSWLAFSEELGLVIGDRASGETFFFTQQTGSSMTFNRSVSGTTQELMALSGTNGIEGPKATVDEVITPLVHSSTWSISMDGDMFSIDYIGN